MADLFPELSTLSALPESVRAALDRLRKLQAVLDAALAGRSLDELLDALLTRVCNLLGADTCAVLLLNEEENVLVARAAKGLEEEVERGVRIPLGRGFAGRIAAEARTISIERVEEADVMNPLLREKGVKSLLGAPLTVRGAVLGVIHAGTLTTRHWTDEDAELLGFVAERIALAIEKARVHEQLVQLDRLKTTFIAVASHELRHPVGVIHGLAATLDRRGRDLPPEQLEELHRFLYEHTERMAQLAEQLLDLSRLDAGAVKLQPQRFPVRARVEEIVSFAAVEHADDVEIDIPAGLEAVADPDAFDRIVSNLITNAFRYGEPPVVVRAAAPDRHFRIVVEDRGLGVPPDVVPHLFERFARSAEPRGGVRGAGLGLSIARSFAEAHGGRLLYERAHPHGARFELVLPPTAAAPPK